MKKMYLEEAEKNRLHRRQPKYLRKNLIKTKTARFQREWLTNFNEQMINTPNSSRAAKVNTAERSKSTEVYGKRTIQKSNLIKERILQRMKSVKPISKVNNRFQTIDKLRENTGLDGYPSYRKVPIYQQNSLPKLKSSSKNSKHLFSRTEKGILRSIFRKKPRPLYESN